MIPYDPSITFPIHPFQKAWIASELHFRYNLLQRVHGANTSQSGHRTFWLVTNPSKSMEKYWRRWMEIYLRPNKCALKFVPKSLFCSGIQYPLFSKFSNFSGFSSFPPSWQKLEFPHPVQNRFNNIQEAFSVVTLGHKLGIEVPSSVLHQQKHAAYQVITPFEHAVGILWLKCLFQSSAKHSLQTFAIILRVDSSIYDIFSGSPELMVTYHLTCPWFQLHQRSEPTVSVASFKAIHASAMLAPLTLTWCEQLKDCKRFVISAEWFVHELLESEATAIAVYNCNGSFRDMASKKQNWNKKQVFLAYALGLWLVIRLTMEMDNLLDWTGLCTLAIKWKLESKDKPLAWRHAACICML